MGDECPKDRWKECPLCQQRIKTEKLKDEFELQSYFVKRIEKYLNDKGRKLIGWDEILEGGLSQTASVMSWRGAAGGIEAAKKGNNVVMTPNSHCYLDYYQTDKIDQEPKAIGGFLPLEKVYSLDPYEGLNAEEQKYILGVQGKPLDRIHQYARSCRVYGASATCSNCRGGLGRMTTRRATKDSKNV